MNKFVEIDPLMLEENVFRSIGRDWMLLTAGKEGKYNTMTASWGGMGVLWNTDVVFAVVRPSRYTYEFFERERHFSLSFFGNSFKRALQFCGTQSGRDCDKVSEAGLLPLFDAPAPYFNEARIAICCKKLYTQDIDPEKFLDPTIASHYPNGDYHRMYIGEIKKILVRK
ncbi:MAG: flavin reductase [Oscillospiraceae bacterium]|nr:flavin reductase [Oscillospiraceae bacterium]